MSRTFSSPKPETTNADRSWEQRWTKKFGQWQKPIRIPSAAVRAGIVDLPPVPATDLSEWLPAAVTFAEPEPRTLDQKLTGIPLSPIQKQIMDEMLASMAMAKELSVDSAVFSGSRETAPLPKPEPREGTSVRSSYLHSVYDPEAFQRTVDITVELMRPHLADFDAIVFRGSSGAALAYPLGYLLKKPLVHVRKELGHAYSKVEGLYGAKRIAIVDDFVASGSTLRTIVEELVAGYAERGYAPPVLTHLFLYSDRCSASEVRVAVGKILEGCEIHLSYDA